MRRASVTVLQQSLRQLSVKKTYPAPDKGWRAQTTWQWDASISTPQQDEGCNRKHIFPVNQTASSLFFHLLPTLPPHLSFSTHTRTPTHKHIVTQSLSLRLLQSLYKGTDAFNWYRGGRHVSIHQVFNEGLRANRGQSLLQNIYRLFVAAIAMMFSSGCQPVCKIFLLKSKQSTLISSFLRFPPVHTFLSLSTVRGLVISRHASRVESRLDSLSNMRKKLLYEPVMMCLQTHSNNKKT